MLAESDFPIEKAIEVFAQFGVEVAFVVPTQTGFAKSIIDAHKSLRAYFKFHGLHDFESQGLGAAESGKKIPVTLVEDNFLLKRELSLYRPKTKSGDPRIWTNLRGYALPYNLLAFVLSKEGQLFIVNCSRSEILESAQKNGSALNEILKSINESGATDKLIGELRKIAALGWVNATRAGDTAVGHTLETLLGIPANSSKRPDYLDQIELKSGRRPPSGRAANRSTMLSKVPDWKRSAMNAGAILKAFGSRNPLTNRLELYVTVAENPNRQGLYLLYTESSDLIENRVLHPVAGDQPVAQWDILKLQEDMRAKHRETFWVQAESRKDDSGYEQLRFVRAIRTRSPMVGNIGPLINSGKITLDFTLSEKPGGGIRDHGYLFRIWPKDLGLLFPSVQNIDLL